MSRRAVVAAVVLAVGVVCLPGTSAQAAKGDPGPGVTKGRNWG